MGKLSVQFDNVLSKEIEEMAKKKGTTETEILRRAIATYRALGKEIEGDGRITVIRDNKIVKELTIS